jgi:hypothetical protein
LAVNSSIVFRLASMKGPTSTRVKLPVHAAAAASRSVLSVRVSGSPGITGVFELAQLYPDFRIPECVGGYSRGERAVPGAYPRTNTPQLWNATTFPLIVQSLLGLVPLAQVGTLLLDPVLPEWLPSLTVRGLRVGETTVTLSFERRDNDTVDWDVVHRRGTLRIVRQPPPESVSAGASDRIWGLVESLMRSGGHEGGSPPRTRRRVGRAAAIACLAVGGAARRWRERRHRPHSSSLNARQLSGTVRPPSESTCVWAAQMSSAAEPL